MSDLSNFTKAQLYEELTRREQAERDAEAQRRLALSKFISINRSFVEGLCQLSGNDPRELLDMLVDKYNTGIAPDYTLRICVVHNPIEGKNS